MSLESQSKVLRNEIESQLQVNHSLTKQLLDCQSETKSWQRYVHNELHKEYKSILFKVHVCIEFHLNRKYDDSLHKHSRDIDNIKRQ